MVSPCYLVVFHLTHHAYPVRGDDWREFFQWGAPQLLLNIVSKTILALFVQMCVCLFFSCPLI